MLKNYQNMSHWVGEHKVIWDGSGTELAGQYTLFYAEGNENHELSTGFLCA
jgi:hypothetical protein